MVEKSSTEKICSLYVNNMHLIVMLIPYIEKELEKGNKIVTILEDDLRKEMGTLINKVNLSKSKKKGLKNINWGKTSLSGGQITKNKADILLVKGDIDFINETNKYIGNNVKKVINCYELEMFENNSREILESHTKILNTLGEKKISEMFHMNMGKNIILTK